MDGISLSALVNENLEAARSSSSARSARTIHGGHDRSLRETVIALLPVTSSPSTRAPVRRPCRCCTAA